MQLKKLLKCLSSYEFKGDLDCEILGITEDSRKVTHNFLFVALKGIRTDGHSFVKEAIEKGAKALLVEKNPKGVKGVSVIQVRDTRKTLGILASQFYENPSTKLKVIGVTGTDGKTTTASLIKHIIEASGKRCGLISTISAKILDKEFDTGLHVTSPDAVSVQKLLKYMVDEKCEYAVLEVTSHALSQERFSGIYFDSAVLTNISHEHLDYHNDFTKYKETKLKLFKSVLSVVILNKDDFSYEDIVKNLNKGIKVISYSQKYKDTNLYSQNLKFLDNESNFEVVEGVNSYTLKTKLLGEHNVSNTLASISVSRYYGVDISIIKKALSTFKAPKGRLEKIKNKKDLEIYIDFAHTPNALEKTLSFFRKRIDEEKSKNKLIVVFGCAGERDIQKRYLMGEIAGKLADITVFTAEDPRSEKVEKIINQMVAGAKKSPAKVLNLRRITDKIREKKHFFTKISERGEAISFAIQKLAEKKDIVVICGKGHEESMAYNGTEYSWSDHRAVEMALMGKVLEIARPGL